ARRARRQRDHSAPYAVLLLRRGRGARRPVRGGPPCGLPDAGPGRHDRPGDHHAGRRGVVFACVGHDANLGRGLPARLRRLGVRGRDELRRTPLPKRTDIQSILIIGAGPIVIGQACEFDYSGVQACKALKAEGYRVILVNSNPATIMTDPEVADATYIEPITPEMVEKIIAKEIPHALLP